MAALLGFALSSAVASARPVVNEASVVMFGTNALAEMELPVERLGGA